MRTKFGLTVIIAFSLVAAACGGGDSDTTTTTAAVAADTTTTTAAAATTTTSEVPAESSPALVAFDGATCTVSGGPVEAGLSEISVLNTSSSLAAALLFLLTSTFTLDTLVGDVTAGRYDNWVAGASDNPPGSNEGQLKIMSPSASESSPRPFTAKSGTWAVVCHETGTAYMGSDVIEVP